MKNQLTISSRLLYRKRPIRNGLGVVRLFCWDSRIALNVLKVSIHVPTLSLAVGTARLPQKEVRTPILKNTTPKSDVCTVVLCTFGVVIPAWYRDGALGLLVLSRDLSK